MHVYKCSIHEDNCPPHFLRTGTLVRAQKYQRKLFCEYLQKYLQNIIVTNHDFAFDFRSKTDHIGRYTISCPAWWLPSSSTYPGQMLPLLWGMSSWERCTSTIWGVSYPVYGLKGIPNLSQEIVWLILNIECLLLAILIIHFRDTNSSWQHLSVYTL